TVDGVYGSGKATTETAVSVVHQRPPLPFLRADVQVELPRNVWVRGPGTAIELGGTLIVVKELGEPFVLGGTVETVRGFTSFYSGSFAVGQVRVLVDETPDFNPPQDVPVTEAVSDCAVFSHVSCRADLPELPLGGAADHTQAGIDGVMIVA